MILIAAAVLLAAAAVVGAVLLLRRPEEEDVPTRPAQTIRIEDPQPIPDAASDLGHGVRITELVSYSGAFVEDGSDEPVSGITAVRVVNEGTENVRLLDFTLTAEDGRTLAFSLTTLLPGQRALVLEQNRAPHTNGKITASTVTRYAPFSFEPSLYPEKLRILCEENAVTVENLSADEMRSVRLYYKNRVGEEFLGGITYSVNYSDLPAESSRKGSTSHFRGEASVVIFVTHDGE